MRKMIVSILAAVAIVSCSQDDTPVDSAGSVSFVVNGSGLGAGKISGLTPEKLVVSVEDKNGKTILSNKVLDLTSSDNGYSTQSFPFETGDYRVTKYLVISGETAAYATPRTGAEKAGLIDKPLPFDFTVTGSSPSPVNPRIIGISSQDAPQYFGYSDFGYDLPESPAEAFMNIKVKLEMILRGIYYENIDATFIVRAFDNENAEVWRQQFDYTGPESNDLKIKDGYHHYTIETQKWGKTLTQICTRASLWDGRIVEGTVPVTHVFQSEVEPRKVASYVTSFTKIVNGQTIVEPMNKTEHQFNEDRISTIRTYVWSRDGKLFVDNTRSEFTYSGNLLKKIATTSSINETSYVEDNYTYDADGVVSHIQHKDSGSGVTTDVDLTFLFGGRVVKAVYRNSNGTGFEYEFANQYGNMKNDKTTRGGELCSDGAFTSDKNINPLKHLGYVDYLMRNLSINNRLTESVNYVGCAFPSLVPESYSYVYDEDGYPLRATTNYRGTAATMETEYTYVN